MYKTEAFSMENCDGLRSCSGQSQFSNQSILFAIERFVKSVSNMNSVVLVPSKLRDITTSQERVMNCFNNVNQDISQKTNATSTTNNNRDGQKTDLYGIYMMLNDIKRESVWGQRSDCLQAPLGLNSSVINGLDDRKSRLNLRQSSDDSIGSSGSSVFCSDAESDSELESLITDKDHISSHVVSLSTSFRFHLHGLQTIFHQLAKYADSVSSIYQEEIDSVGPRC